MPPCPLASVYVTLSGKSSLILGENKAAFRREGHIFLKISYLKEQIELLMNMVVMLYR